MKKKLIAIMLTATIVGGVSTQVYADGPNCTGGNCVSQCSQGTCTTTKGNCQKDCNSVYNEDILLNNKLGNNCDESRIDLSGVGSINDLKGNLKEFINEVHKFINSIMGNNSQDNKPNCESGNCDENSPNNNEGDSNGGTENNKPETEKPPVVEAPPVAQEKPQTPPATEKPKPPVAEKPAPPVTENKPTVEKPQTPSNDKFMAAVEKRIFERVNEERAKAGVPALSYNDTMEKYARIKSQDMGDRGYFDHTNPEGQLITAKMQQDGVSYRAWGENIAYIGGMSDATALADSFMNNWMNSPGHRQNILSNNFSSIGVGVYKIGNEVYATQEFYR